MKNAMLVVIVVGGGVWFLLNYSDTITLPPLTRWLPLLTSPNGLVLGLIVGSILILLAWAGFRKPGR